MFTRGVLLDGRDTAPESALGFIERLEATFRVAGVGRIASVMGRYYAMDRDNRWDRTALAYACLTGRPVAEADLIEAGLQPRRSPSAAEAVRHQYRNPPGPSRRGDEFTIPTTIVPPEGEDGLRFVEDGDTIIFFNFRGDRPRQICKAFTLDDAAWGERERGGFDRGAKVRDLFFCTFTSYEEGLPVHVAFPRRAMMKNILGRVLADRGLTQFRCAETEKFAHVTFFFNDYQERPFDGERRMMVPSPTDVTTYDQKPEMSAAGVCESVVRRLARPDCEPIMIVNFANADMVGHTGVLAAAVRAIETVDAAVGRVIEAVLARNASAVITADHGNAEQMWDPLTESPHTAHTTYDVPLIVAGAAFAGATLRSGGRLGDIAPTMLEMAGLAAPPEMTGESLLG